MKAQVIEGYANQKVLDLLDKGDARQQNWLWTLLKCLRQRYPQADHYLTSTHKPTCICIGTKKLGPGNGAPVFGLYWFDTGKVFICYASKDSNLRKVLKAKNKLCQIDATNCPTAEGINKWLDEIDHVLEGKQLPVNGTGLMPSDYEQPKQDEHNVTTPYATLKPVLNQILFGPPGTGKTYATIDHALAILAPDFIAANLGKDAETRKRLKTEFDRFVREDRVRFVTFHQSFSYEDFVEGIRADTDTQTGQLRYPIEPGVFKRICDDARTRPAADLGVRANPAIWKISIDGTGASPSKSYCLANGEARIGWGGTGDLREEYEQNPYYQGLGAGNKGTLDYFAEQMAVGDILLCIHSAEQIGSIGVVTSDYRYETQVPAGVISDYQHVRSVRWLYRDINLSILPLNDEHQFTLKTVYAMNRFTWADLLSYLQQQTVKPVEAVTVGEASNEPYVLIIDEINRGNVSRIFGELITLIEESKRDGETEALSLKLPYSKKPFSVPKNVYLLGTMNTADRSLAGLDIALRRRFTFKEMLPEPEWLKDVLVEGIDIRKLLEVMNQRIEVLLDRDHCLGHAYFIPLKVEPSLQRLESIFRNQILPLLQEYFFEDWQRIQWVLNDHRKPAEDCFVVQFKPELNDLFGSTVTGVQGGMWRVMSDAFKRVSAYAGIIAAKPAEPAGTSDVAVAETVD